MWTQANALLLLLACCLWAVQAQSDNPRANGNAAPETRKSVWEDPIQFSTKAQDLCTLIVTGQGDFTRLRISCQGRDSAYWCEYTGKPQLCRSYSNNPRHYFAQIMWDLRKLQNACQAPRTMKPQMCKRAPEDSQMVFAASSTPEAAAPQKPERPQEKQPTQTKPEIPKAPTTRQAKPAAARPEQAKPPRPEQARPAKSEAARSEQARPEQARPEVRPAPTRPVQPRLEPVRPEQAKPEARPAPTRPVQPRPEPVRPDPARPARPVVVKSDPPRPDPEQSKAAPVKPVKPIVKTTALRKSLTPKPAAPKPTKPAVKSNAKKTAQEYCWRSLQGICTYVFGWFQN